MNISTLIQVGQVIPKNIISDGIRITFMTIDSIVYSLIGIFFSIAFSITNLEKLSVVTELYTSIQSRVFVVIGVFMLFKVTISLLTYLVDPDKINDKEMGAGKLITRIVTSLVLLIIVPTIVFPFLSDIQLPMLNTVGKVIIGQSNSINGDSVLSYGQEAAQTVLGAFFYVEDGCAIESENNTTIFANIVHVNDVCNAVDENGNSLGIDKTKYKYNYWFFVSTIFAIVPVILLIIIAVNIAIRSFKLIVLKILAPIPILSYIDPKSSKDGMFSSYTKLFTKTYLDLFVQFGVLYFVILALERVIESFINVPKLVYNFVDYNINVTPFSFIFVFIGLLMFAVMAPKFIKKALNLKDSEFGTGLAGMLTTGAVIAGATGSAVRRFSESAENGGGRLSNFGSAIAGAVGGLTSGAMSGFSNGKTDPSKVLGTINDYNARTATLRRNGFGPMDRVANWFQTTFTGSNRAIELENQRDNLSDELKERKERLSLLKQAQSASKNMSDLASSEAQTNNNVKSEVNVGGNSYSGKTTEFLSRLAADVDGKGFDWGGRTWTREEAEYYKGEIIKSGASDWVATRGLGTYETDLTRREVKYDNQAREITESRDSAGLAPINVDDLGEIKAQIGQLTTAVNDQERAITNSETQLRNVENELRTAKVLNNKK